MPSIKTVALILAVAAVALGGRYYLLSGNDTAAPGVASPAAEGAQKQVIGGPFTLTDSHGKTVTEASFAGKYMLVYFGYTYCPDVCPTSLQTMAAALRQLSPQAAAKIAPVFISVDPARDSPEHIGQYVDYFYPGMVGLTGTEEQVAQVARTYRVYYAKVPNKDGDPNAYLMDHSAITYLMGPDGAFISHFPHDVTPEKMAAKLAELP